MKCPLCESIEYEPFFKDKRRSFYFCKTCELLFVPPENHIAQEEEIKRYDLHDNRRSNSGYVRFLQEVAAVAKQESNKQARILDFGCGKNAVLRELLETEGFNSEGYDPLYSIGTRCLSRKYDLIILCEVVEHLRNLKNEVAHIKEMLGREGKLILRTNVYPSDKDFPTWWYKEDMTHINFICEKTIEVFGGKLGLNKVKRVGKDMFVLER